MARRQVYETLWKPAMIGMGFWSDATSDPTLNDGDPNNSSNVNRGGEPDPTVCI